MNRPRHRDLVWTAPERLAELAAGEKPWRYYRATAVTITPPGGPAVTIAAIESDAPSGAGTGAGGAGAQIPLPGPGGLHVITAVQPGADPGAPDSAVRLQVLEAELRAAGHDPIPATGSAIDGSHAEPGFAVTGWTDELAREWGVRFGQVAVFGLRGPTLSLIACAADRRDDRHWHARPR